MRWSRRRSSTRCITLSFKRPVLNQSPRLSGGEAALAPWPKGETNFQTPSSQPEPETEWRVGSLRSLTEGESNFQRVVDENAEARRNEELSTGGGSESENIGRE